jgi:hypothetical protein
LLHWPRWSHHALLGRGLYGHLAAVARPSRAGALETATALTAAVCTCGSAEDAWPQPRRPAASFSSTPFVIDRKPGQSRPDRREPGPSSCHAAISATTATTTITSSARPSSSRRRPLTVHSAISRHAAWRKAAAPAANAAVAQRMAFHLPPGVGRWPVHRAARGYRCCRRARCAALRWQHAPSGVLPPGRRDRTGRGRRGASDPAAAAGTGRGQACPR